MNCLSMPDTVSWEVTEQCNLKCKHCSNATNGIIHNISLEKCKYIIDTLSKFKVFRLNIEGGEPFIRSDLLDLIEYANSKNLYPKIDTNGTLITEDIAKKLSSKCKVNLVQVSIDGPNENVYSSVRKSKDSFIMALNGIRNLVKYNIKTSIAMVLMKDNIKYIPELLKLAESLGVNYVRFMDFIPTGRGNQEQCPTSEQLKNAYLYLNKYTNNDHTVHVIKPTKIVSLIEKNNPATILKLVNRNCTMMCEAGTILCHIKANGDVTPCVYLRDEKFICGNILKDNFKKIWEESAVMNEMRNIGQLLNKCANCSSKFNCMGGCRAYAYHSTGSISGMDIRCWNGDEC